MEYEISDNALVGIEHPCVFSATEKAVRSLGGDRQLKDLVVAPPNNAQANLYLRPKDPFAVPIQSEQIKTDDLLLQVKVPKLVQVRKKRTVQEHANDPRRDQAETSEVNEAALPQAGAKRLLRSMKDNPARCSFNFVGYIEHTHRFRSMPDYGFATSSGSFARDFVHKVAPMKYDLLKQYAINPNADSSRQTELIPPPRMSNFRIPFNYRYRQNPAVKQVMDESGNVELVNDQRARKTYTSMLTFNAETVPDKVSDSAPKLEELGAELQELVRELQKRFEQRPIWTRRALTNDIDREDWRHMYKYGFEHVGYMFRSGPWREAVIKLGVDPRTDHSYRIYQTMTFQLDNSANTQADDQKAKPQPGRRGGRRVRKPDLRTATDAPRRSHIFDGMSVGMDGRVWQVCDILEPTLRSVLETDSVRNTCHIRTDGWYHNGTWAKARSIAKAKMQALVSNEPGPSEDDLDRIASMPDVIDERTKAATFTSRKDSPQYIEMANNLRGMASSPEREVGREGGRNGGVSQVEGSTDAMDGVDREQNDEYVPIDPRVTDAMKQLEGSLGEDGLESDEEVESEEEENEEADLSGEEDAVDDPDELSDGD